MKKEIKKEPSTSKASSSKKRTKSGEDDVTKKRKPKKKKDPNAPKRAMSGFMFFSQLEREVDIYKHTHTYVLDQGILTIPNYMYHDSHFSCVPLQNVKKDNPGIAFQEIGRVLGERWNKLSGFIYIFFSNWLIL